LYLDRTIIIFTTKLAKAIGAFLMRYVMLYLMSAAILVSPCAYDTDPREPSAIAAMIAQAKE
jgi:hypothetical protein